jgi:DNA-binding beta-propeller fold protein YncE
MAEEKKREDADPAAYLVPDGTVETIFGCKGADLAGLAGAADGKAGLASFKSPTGVALSADGALVFIADYGNHKLRVADLASRRVTTLAGSGVAGGSDGDLASATLNYLHYLAATARSVSVLHRIRQFVRSCGGS